MADNATTRRRGGAHFASPDGTPRGSSSAGARFSRSTPETPAAPSRAAAQPAARIPQPGVDVPTPVAPAATSSFSTIRPGQGAVVTTRDTAARAAETAHESYQAQGSAKRLTGSNRPQYKTQDRGRGISVRSVVLMLVVVAVVALGGFLIASHFLHADDDGQQESTLVQEKQVDADSGIEYGGYTYQVDKQDDGTYALTRTASGSSTSYALFSIEGEPVALVVNNGVFLIPENTDSGWDVVCYAMGDGSVATKMTDSDGNELGGSGSLADASISDGILTLVEEGGATQQVSLS